MYIIQRFFEEQIDKKYHSFNFIMMLILGIEKQEQLNLREKLKELRLPT